MEKAKDNLTPSKELFNPNEIDVDISVVNMGTLLDYLQNGEIDLNPDFQRSSDIWNKQEKSRLIESILLGLPLPAFYFSEDPITKNYAIVDGLQRLCAIKDFWFGTGENLLVLKGLQFLKELEGKTRLSLDREFERRFIRLKITLNILRKDTPRKVKYVLFQRVNTGGKPLNQQEIRNSLYSGKARDLLQRMANSEDFKAATGDSISTKRMADRDYANRFLAFYLNVEKYKGNLDGFLCDALEDVTNMSYEKIEDTYEAFIKSMSICFELMGKNAFRYPIINQPGKYTKVNKSIFESLGVSIAKLNSKEQAKLVLHKRKFEEKYKNLLYSTEFRETTESGTAKIPKTRQRFRLINELIKECIYD